MRTKIMTPVLAVGVAAAACVGTAEAASSEPRGHRGIVGTGVASMPCEDVPCPVGLRPPTRAGHVRTSPLIGDFQITRTAR